MRWGWPISQGCRLSDRTRPPPLAAASASRKSQASQTCSPPGRHRMQVLHQDEAVFEFIGKRHRPQVAAGSVKSIGHVVVDPVGEPVKVLRRQQVRRTRAFVAGRAEPAANFPFRRRLQATTATRNQFRFFLRGKPAVMQAVHIPAVGDDFAVTLTKRLNQAGGAFADGAVDRETSASGESGRRRRAGGRCRPGCRNHAGCSAQVRIGHGHSAGRRKRLAALVQRKELYTDIDPQGQPAPSGHATDSRSCSCDQG